MMEQCGNSLLGLLIDDLEAEHRAHELSLATLVELMDECAPEALRQPLQRFIDELRAHVQIEDEVLFRRFPRAVAVRPT